MGLAPYGEVKYLKELSEIIQKTDDGFLEIIKNILNISRKELRGLGKWWAKN